MQFVQTHTFYRILLLIGFICTGTIAHAGDGGGIVARAILDGSKHQIKIDSSRTVEDSAFFNPANAGLLDTAYTVQNIITLKINEASPLYLRTAFTATVKLWIIYSNGNSTDSILRTFSINYDSAHTYNSRNSFVFNGGRRVTVRVDTVMYDAAWDVTSVLVIENQLTAKPKYLFSCTNTVANITVSPFSDPKADELPVTWTTVRGADQYDVEWAYIDSCALADHKYGNPLNPALVFLHNSTRISITGTSYNIPLMYDNTGTLFIRVRPVQIGQDNSVTAAIWSSDANPSVMGQYTFTGHERPLNWLSDISFAEEGKRKIIIQYYDGSLHSRQMVTKDNINNNTLVAETFYDYQGRPAIEVLPAPSLKNVIQYTAGFNVSINHAEYSQSNFDTLLSPDQYCQVSAEAMSADSGASQYYSPNNPNKKIGLNQFIPDAKNYPFTETEYTQDNTGRIRRQGGVGPDHQLGTGHETKYYYGTPDQNELDALFGTDVGDKSHYFKNMVRDANGQYSVTYVDMHNRTIATALAGAAPASMVPLASNIPAMITENLADSGSRFLQDWSIVSQKSMVVPVADSFTFNYKLDPASLAEENCDQKNICYTCLYDLQITITDNCNNQLLPGGKAFDTVIHNFSFGQIDTACSSGQPMNLSFKLYLPEGSYQVTKSLTVNRDAYVYYRDSVYLPNNTCLSMTEFVNEQRAIIAAANTQCIPDCQSCRDSVGTFEQFRAGFISKAGILPADSASFREEIAIAYKNAVASCNALCGDSSAIDNDIRSAMLQDMTPPYGQYADTIKGVYADRYSIFYIDDKKSDTWVPVYRLDAVQYLDANGRPDFVYNLESDLMVEPGSLTMSQFVQNFRSSWAEALLPYHPEYCKLKALEAQKTSNVWDRRMEAIDNFRDARDSGYLNPTGNGSYPYPVVAAHRDPLSLDATLKSRLEAKLTEYLAAGRGNPKLSMWAMACVLAKCEATSVSCIQFYGNNPANVFDTENMCEGDLDMAWRNFRQLYLGFKQDLVNELVNKPTGCTPANPALNNIVPTYATLINDRHQPQFHEDAKKTVSGPENPDLRSILQATSNSSSAVTAAQQQFNSFYEQNIDAMVQQWATQLSTCAYSEAALRDTILPWLKGLSMKAVDTEHPFGASTLPAGVTYTPDTVHVFTSFEQIINTYNQEHNISNSAACNADLITSPQPYDRQPVYSNKPVLTKPSACECTRINDLYIKYRLTRRDPSFAAYLKRTQGITMTNSDLAMLRDLCNNPGKPTAGGPGCVFLQQPIYLPPSMQCNSGEVCASCTMVQNLYENYIQQYPADTPRIADPEDTLQNKRNDHFSRYMNNRLGFSLQAVEYLQFITQCAQAYDSISNTTECVDQNVGNLYVSQTVSGKLEDIQITSGSGYIMAGSSGLDGILVKTDSSGNRQWTKKYGGNGEDYFTRVRPTSDNGYIAIGTTKSGHYSTGAVWIVKVDAGGTVSWTKNIGFNTPFGDRGYDIIETSDGGYAALGIYNQHTGHGEFILSRLEADGTIDWIKRFGASRLQDNGFGCTPAEPDTLSYDGTPAYGLLQKGDTLLIAGATYDRNMGDRYFGVVYKFDSWNGGMIDSWHYADSSATTKSSWFQDIKATANGYMVTVKNADQLGTNNQQVAVLHLSDNGAVQSYKRMNLPAGSSKTTSFSVYPTSDGGYIVAQTVNNGTHIFWQKMDAGGSLMWSTETALPGNQVIGRVIQNNDSSFTLVGSDSQQMLMLNLLPGGSCFDNTVNLGATAVSMGRINWAWVTDQLMVPVHTDTTFISMAPLLSDSIINCPGSGNCYNIYNGPLLCGKSQPLLPDLGIDSTTACADSTFFAVSKGTELYRTYNDSLTGHFEERYINTCLQAYRYESFTVTHARREHHYTLYYYDQAGNLVRTVPPAGVQPNYDTTWLKQVRQARETRQQLVPAHTMASNYRYNTLDQVVAQHSPDGGVTYLWYDRLGRLAISQNAKQYDSAQYSYARYDSISRIIEQGQINSNTVPTDIITRNTASLLQWFNSAEPTASQITKTVYDYEYTPLQPIMTARNLRNRVAWKAVYPTAADLNNNNFASATYYTYDVVGLLDTLVQDYKSGIMAATGNRFKKIVYEYDFPSGKISKVSYQPGQTDAYYHRYLYDAENRITNIQVSIDSINWENDAFYSYYDHGTLARIVLGEQQVQGINYAYNLHGWPKAINPDIHTGSGYNLKEDGSNGSIVAKPVYHLLLNFYNGDYSPISGAVPQDSSLNVVLGNDYSPLYNGNISSMGVSITALNNPILYNYKYDQLNRLVKMDAWHRTGNSWGNINKLSDFQERISYDPNGNILGYKRNGNQTFVGKPLNMDSLTYKYILGTNRIDHVQDSVADSNYDIDIDSQHGGNYSYDAMGNLVKDSAEGINNISWNVYGKINQITKSNGVQILFDYDAAGNRIGKKKITGADTTITFYVCDAQGNVMSVYSRGVDSINNGDLTQTEVHLHGRTRLGIWQRSIDMEHLAPASDTMLSIVGKAYDLSFVRGDKIFELSNHLGNVLTTVSDKKFGISTNDSTVDYFIPETISAQDYYPFGMLQTGRNYVVGGKGKYRYGFNGKENDNDVKGEGEQLDYGMRIYDPRLGRFLSSDPLASSYPWFSPYQFAGNSPIWSIDIDGMESNEKTDHNELPEVIVVGKKKSPEKMSWDDIPTERYEMPSKGKIVWNQMTTQGHQTAAQAFAATRQDMPDVDGVAVFDLDEYTTIVTTHSKVVFWSESLNDYYKGVHTTYTVFRADYYNSLAIFGGPDEKLADLSEDEFFSKPDNEIRSAIVIDMLPGSSGGKAGKLVRNGIKVGKFASLRVASRYGVKAYNLLRKAVAGKGYAVHHLYEQRFAKYGLKALGDPKKWASIVVTKAEHIKFTTDWRRLIAYKNSGKAMNTTTATEQQIKQVARQVYKDYPEILKALGL